MRHARRHVCILDSPQFGLVAYVAIGATFVGSIVITNGGVGTAVHRGEEHGYFAFGGSTVVLVFQPGRIRFDADLVDSSETQVEALVQMGMRIGQASLV